MENIIIGGLDFNLPPNPVLDKKGGLLIPRKSVVATIDNLKEKLDLFDVCRIKNPKKKASYSKRISRERNEREKSLKGEYAKAKHIFEIHPKIKLKISWNCLKKK